MTDNPEVFGLHSNSDLVFRTAQTGQVLSTILDISPKDSGNRSGESKEDAVLREIESLESRLPLDFKPEEVKGCIKTLGGQKPLNICLVQEVDRLQKVITVVRTSLSNLRLAIAGTVVLSSDLSDAIDSLFLARVPSKWTKVSDLIAPTLGVWFSNILMRSDQLSAWLKHARPHCFWLTGFFNPQGFLTANRQEVCRKHAKDNWALDDVVNLTKVFSFEKEEVKRPPEEGIYIYGLFLDGCRWDKQANKLVDSMPKVIFAPLPVLLVTGQPQGDKKADVYNYACPCYKNPKRGGHNL